MLDSHQVTLKFKRSASERQAEIRSITNLLNCYCREYAAPRGQVFVNPTFGTQDWPEALRRQPQNGNERSVVIVLPETSSRIVVRVADLKVLGQCRLISTPYFKRLGRGWQKLNHDELGHILLRHLADVYGQPLNVELAAQIQNSLSNSKAFLASRASVHPTNTAKNRLVRDGFIASEQALLWGHTWHPTPKSREGIDTPALLKISPEVGASFQLRYLAVKNNLLDVINSVGFDSLQVIKGLFGTSIDDGFSTLPCHPYQFDKFKTHPLFVSAIEQGLIIDLGEQGENWCPTSSVRTLYNNKSDYFLKFSLHVRLTNCIRKNAWYELESALYLNALVSKLKAETKQQFPAFNIMQEPGSITLNLTPLVKDEAVRATEGDAVVLSEAFGVLFRESFNRLTLEQRQPRVTAALFADKQNLKSAITPYVDAYSTSQALPHSQAATLWFQCYVNALLPPILYCFFKQGIVFEPHLQNVVVGFSQHAPTHIYLRDLEGAKLIDTMWAKATLTELSPRARKSIHYTREQGWQRIAYCTLINNISEAIYHLSGDSGEQEVKMWGVVKSVVEQYQSRFGEEPELNALLAGSDIPCKCNLLTRLLKQADKNAGYVMVPNPMGESL